MGLMVESGELREVHQFCTLMGYGADAVGPGAYTAPALQSPSQSSC